MTNIQPLVSASREPDFIGLTMITSSIRLASMLHNTNECSGEKLPKDTIAMIHTDLTLRHLFSSTIAKKSNSKDSM